VGLAAIGAEAEHALLLLGRHLGSVLDHAAHQILTE
jgi:hypothetical protein